MRTGQEGPDWDGSGRTVPRLATVTAERSKPPSVRLGIRLSGRALSELPWRHGLAPARVRRSIPSRPSAHGRTARCVPRPRCDRGALDGSASFPCGSGRARPRHPGRAERRRPLASHRSGRGVSFLFQSQPSPTPGLRRVARPDGGGTFLIGPRGPTGAELSLPVGWRRDRWIRLRSTPRSGHLLRITRLIPDVRHRYRRLTVFAPNPPLRPSTPKMEGKRSSRVSV